MRGIRLSILPVLLILLPLSAAAVFRQPQKQASVDENLNALVESERSFARAVQAKGIREGFLGFLAPDGVLFRPGPVNGLQFLNARPASPGFLSWEPIFAEVSRAGDLGYTTGPYQFKQSETSPPSGFGNYMTIWRKHPDGVWKVEIDFGSSAPGPPSDRAALIFARPSLKGRTPASAGTQRALLAIDREFAQSCARDGFKLAYKKFAAPDIRLMRQSQHPRIGAAAAINALSPQEGTFISEPKNGRLSASADLGYTYGTYALDGTATESGHYLHIWRYRGGWKIALDIAIPLPRA